MFSLKKSAFCLVFLSAFLASPALPQARAQKPALIRDTGVAEGKEDAKEEDKAKPFNPMLAEKSVNIGDFYFKRKNYKAAIARYLEAIQYQPNRFEAYEALARAYEKSGEQDKALAVYKDFISKYPESSKADEFRSRADRIEKEKG